MRFATNSSSVLFFPMTATPCSICLIHLTSNQRLTDVSCYRRRRSSVKENRVLTSTHVASSMKDDVTARAERVQAATEKLETGSVENKDPPPPSLCTRWFWMFTLTVTSTLPTRYKYQENKLPSNSSSPALLRPKPPSTPSPVPLFSLPLHPQQIGWACERRSLD